MNWNYRITKRIHNHEYLHEPETLYEIREVYYDESGKVQGWAEMPEVISESIDGLKWNLERMMESCNKPVIDYNSGAEVE